MARTHAFTRLATPSTPQNYTESKMDQPVVTGDASSTKSFYEKLEDLLTPDMASGRP